jgi:hypothetical protein
MEIFYRAVLDQDSGPAGVRARVMEARAPARPTDRLGIAS